MELTKRGWVAPTYRTERVDRCLGEQHATSYAPGLPWWVGWEYRKRSAKIVPINA